MALVPLDQRRGSNAAGPRRTREASLSAVGVAGGRWRLLDDRQTPPYSQRQLVPR